MRMHKQNDLLNKIGVGSTQDLKNRIKNREEQEAETVEGKKFAREEIIKAGQIIDNLIEEYGSES